VTTVNTHNCTNTSISGTITVDPVTVNCPPDAATVPTVCATVGSQQWSGPRAISAGCTKRTDFSTGSSSANYRSDGLSQGSGYLYNWICVRGQAWTLCPYPWSLPTAAQYCELITSVSGVACPDAGAGVVIVDAVSELLGSIGRFPWGGVPSGFLNGSTMTYPGACAAYWANTTVSTAITRVLRIDTNGFVVPQDAAPNEYGLQVRCVKY
jgi:uncharacterized protein (TIGR02145 family)